MVDLAPSGGGGGGGSSTGADGQDDRREPEDSIAEKDSTSESDPMTDAGTTSAPDDAFRPAPGSDSGPMTGGDSTPDDTDTSGGGGGGSGSDLDGGGGAAPPRPDDVPVRQDDVEAGGGTATNGGGDPVPDDGGGGGGGGTGAPPGVVTPPGYEPPTDDTTDGPGPGDVDPEPPSDDPVPDDGGGGGGGGTGAPPGVVTPPGYEPPTDDTTDGPGPGDVDPEPPSDDPVPPGEPEPASDVPEPPGEPGDGGRDEPPNGRTRQQRDFFEDSYESEGEFAEDAAAFLGEGFTEEDVRVVQDGDQLSFELTASGRRTRRQQLKEDYLTNLQRDLGEAAGVVDSEDIVVSETDEGLSVGLADAAQREVAAFQLDAELQADIGVGDVRKTDDGYGLTESALEDVASDRRNALAGIGFDQTADGEWIAPDAPGQETFAKQQQEDALIGIGYDETAEGEFRPPDAAGEETLAEQQQEDALIGIGYDETAEGEFRPPDSAGEETLAEQRASERQVRAMEGIGYEGAGENVRAPDAEGQLNLREQAAREQAREQAADQFSDELGFEVSADEVELTREDGELTAAYGGEGTPVEQKGVAGLVEGFEETTGLDVPGEGPVVRTVPEGEQFGDIDWSFGLGGPGDEVEQSLDTVTSTITSVTAAGAGVIDSLQPGSAGVGDTTEFSDALAPAEATLLPGSVGSATEVGEGMIRGGGAIVGQAPQLVTEAPEVVGYAVTNPGATARKLPGAVATRSVQFGESYTERPVQMTGALVGSAALSAGVFRATQGTRVGSAARWSIQPGEEAVKAAVRRGALGSRAVTLTPGVRQSQIEGRSAGGSVRSSVETRLAEARTRVSNVRERGPGVSVEADPDAPVLRIDPEVKQQVYDATAGRAQSGAEAVRNAPEAVGDLGYRAGARAGERAGSAAQRVSDLDAQSAARSAGRRAGRVEQGVRQQVTRADLQAEDLGFRAGQRTRAGVDRVLDLDPGAFMSRAQSRARQEATRAELQAEDIGYRAGVRAGETASRIADLSRPSAGGAWTRATDAVSTSRQTLTRWELQAEDAGYRAGVRTREGVDRVLELSPREFMGDAQSRARQELTRAELQAEDIGYRAGERTARAVNTLNDIEFGNVRGRGRQEFQGLRFGLAERRADITRGVQNVRDLTIRVGDPERETIFDTERETGEPAVRSQIDNPLGIEGDTSFEPESDTDGDGLLGDQESRPETGTGLDAPQSPSGARQQGTRTRDATMQQGLLRRTEQEGEQETDSTDPLGTGWPGFETTVPEDTPPGLSVSFGGDSVLDEPGLLDGTGMGDPATGSSIDPLVTPATETPSRDRVGTPEMVGGLDLMRPQTTYDAAVDQTAATGVETAVETAAEVELETAIAGESGWESEFFGLLDGPEGGDTASAAAGGASDQFQEQLLDPLGNSRRSSQGIQASIL